MVIICQNNTRHDAHSVTAKPVALDGFITTTIIQNIGGVVVKNAKMPLAGDGGDSQDSHWNKGKMSSAPIHVMQNAQVLFNYIAKHTNMAASIGSLTVADLIKWCQIIDESNHGE